MTDNLPDRDGPDDSRINLHQAYKVRYWTQKWSITETILKTAVTAAGVPVKDVEAWLRRNGYIK